MSAANWLEAAIVIDGAGSPIASRRFDEAVAEAGIVIEPVTPEQAEIGSPSADIAFGPVRRRDNTGTCLLVKGV